MGSNAWGDWGRRRNREGDEERRKARKETKGTRDKKKDGRYAAILPNRSGEIEQAFDEQRGISAWLRAVMPAKAGIHASYGSSIARGEMPSASRYPLWQTGPPLSRG